MGDCTYCFNYERYYMIEKEDCKTLEEYCEKLAQEYKDEGWSHTPRHAQLSFYQESNVNTIEEAIKWDLYGEYSDWYKDTHGFRPRFDFREYSIEELKKMIDDQYDAYCRQKEMERKTEQNNWKRYRQKMIQESNYFGISLKERVEEDIRKADVMYGDSGQVDLGYYCYKFNFPVYKRYIIARVLEQKIKYECGDALVHIEPI